jgi:protease YdgD
MVGHDLGIVRRNYQRGWIGLLALLPSLAAAQHLPGLGDIDPRVAADMGRPPWSSIVRLQIPGVSVCTAFMVSPTRALTAAHCLYGARLGHFAPAPSIHLLSGYSDGAFAQHVVAQSYGVAQGYDPREPDETRGADAALIILAAPLSGIAGLALAEALPPDGASLTLAGFSQDRAQRLQIDPSCQALGLVADSGGRTLLRHSCAGTRGTSGGPLLVQSGDGIWRVAGLQSGANAKQIGGIAVAAETLGRLLKPQ